MIKTYNSIEKVKGSIAQVRAEGVKLGELAEIKLRDGRSTLAEVISFSGDKVNLQIYRGTRGVSTGDQTRFLSKPMQVAFGDSLLGRVFNGAGEPVDGGAQVAEEKVEIGGPSFNPSKRIVPKRMIKTNIPMIDMFNTLVRSQKIPIFSIPGEPYNELLARIASQTDADVIVLGGMGLKFDDYEFFYRYFTKTGAMEKTTMFIHTASDPVVECILVPDMALAVAEQFAVKDKNVLVLLTDMTSFADAQKEISISMEMVPSNRGYPGSLYSDLASRYEKAVDIDGSGSITVIAVTTMPGDDVTHPVPDNTGYITEGQFYLHNGAIDPFGSLSRLKQQVMGKVTRKDHGDLANAMIRLYADAKKAKDRESMGFRLSEWDRKLIKYAVMFERDLMDLSVNLDIEEQLDLGWKILSECFAKNEVGLKAEWIEKYGKWK
ncbi:MAG TPA: V-type ATP synthase subunit B [Spirochaetota bacterium]|jgi:V/A-type H+-transporting ATPase subunit B|nr:V-type ATP synthase subunit B [Spirochaetota bacterium]HOR45072.1 V-type ATP synthase subunit B [Spirochaetota bacterium]HOU83651.1 V-type ATP synthase subunit B [Spirochaetota bacterium]HPK56730.1 V-type ATP synthase subunit B [Spirochaetota bacterium]HQE59253.1 V-type ATP synthase subunit B [Spirochaetota bacterium]